MHNVRQTQKRVCPHGTTAIESLSWFDETDLATVVWGCRGCCAEDAAVTSDVEEVEVDDAGRATGPSFVRSTTSASSESLLSAGGCSHGPLD